MLIGWITAEVPSLDGYLISLSPEARAVQDDGEETVQVSPEVLWPMQPALVEKAAASLQPREAAGPRIGVIAVAAGGSQQLFGREARAALGVLVNRSGPGAGRALLSNARADHIQVPLATSTNLLRLLKLAGAKFDGNRDLMVIYLAAHGGRNAALGTDLPDYQQLDAISAQNLAKWLDAAGIKRRMIVVSACFSGAWIKPLASPDTIVITAAAADRTSFGCDDKRQYTVFGDAFINGSLRSGASYREAFEELKRRVATEEQKEGATPSLPQAFVGEGMTQIWSERRTATIAGR